MLTRFVTDDPTDFVEITMSGSNSLLKVDTDGDGFGDNHCDAGWFLANSEGWHFRPYRLATHS